MCNLETSWQEESMKLPGLPEILERLQEMKQDGLIEIEENHLLVTEKGRTFARNIAMAFDLRLIRRQPQTRIFSMTV